jgi:hypothetical protein
MSGCTGWGDKFSQVPIQFLNQCLGRLPLGSSYSSGRTPGVQRTLCWAVILPPAGGHVSLGPSQVWSSSAAECRRGNTALLLRRCLEDGAAHFPVPTQQRSSLQSFRSVLSRFWQEWREGAGKCSIWVLEGGRRVHKWRDFGKERRCAL